MTLTFKNLTSHFLLLCTTVAAMSTLGCSQSSKGMATGAPIGANAASAITAANPQLEEGTPFGATSNTLAGKPTAPAIDKTKKSSEKEQKEFMQRQADAMKKQEDELDDLRRQRYHDEYLRNRYGVDEAERAE